MEMEFIRNRITELRLKKGVSEYQLSYDLGHSKNYIHNIVTGYSQPSVKELLYLIDTLGITPRLFFDEEEEYRNPILGQEIIDGIKSTNDHDLEAVLLIVRRLNEKNKQVCNRVIKILYPIYREYSRGSMSNIIEITKGWFLLLLTTRSGTLCVERELQLTL